MSGTGEIRGQGGKLNCCAYLSLSIWPCRPKGRPSTRSRESAPSALAGSGRAAVGGNGGAPTRTATGPDVWRGPASAKGHLVTLTSVRPSLVACDSAHPAAVEPPHARPPVHPGSATGPRAGGAPVPGSTELESDGGASLSVSMAPTWQY